MKKPLELYIHIPFCVKKCAYCDFLSAPADEKVRLSYLHRLSEEICFYAPEYREYCVTSIFIGGGTPTILTGRQIRELMDIIKNNFEVDAKAEVTIECNPGTLTGHKASDLHEAGINRISIGLQSANNLELAMLGRIHTWEDFLESFGEARKAGFRNINVDLMSALPGQTQQTWQQTLKKVTDLHPEHISAYSLMIEEGTPFYQIYHEDDLRRERGEKPRLLPTEESERAMYLMTEEYLAQKGYHRYEISNYAKTGFSCRHNIGYWRRNDYLGLGLGAASLIDNVRFSNIGELHTYMEAPFVHTDQVILDRKAQMEEFMFLGLRMMDGISAKEFADTFQLPIEAVYGDVIRKLKNGQLLKAEGGRLYLTPRGIDVSNIVLADFIE